MMIVAIVFCLGVIVGIPASFLAVGLFVEKILGIRSFEETMKITLPATLIGAILSGIVALVILGKITKRR
jgi:riboflavin transporter FmnP